jgi:hypothetical protein
MPTLTDHINTILFFFEDQLVRSTLTFVVIFNGTTQLYELLINNQGGEAVIPVLRNNEEIFVMVRVPTLNVPLADVSFLF